MKAIRIHEFGGPEVMRLEETADLQPGPDQVLIQTKAIGVNPVDTYIRSGSYAAKPQLPYTPGMDAAGVVVKVGADVRRVQLNERVYAAGTVSGAYAEHAICDESQVHKLPRESTFEEGAAIGVPYGTAYRALFQKAHAKPGEWVLVHGATGGVGIAAIQLARAAGMVVVGTGGTAQGRKLIAEQGAHHVLDHKAPRYLDELMSLSENRGVDVILECWRTSISTKILTCWRKAGAWW
ncbi:MAG: NADPH:quinone reductase [Pyrinomonadaceae bacterium]